MSDQEIYSEDKLNLITADFLKIRQMKPSEFLEKYYGIKLFGYQKIIVDVYLQKKKTHFLRRPYDAINT